MKKLLALLFAVLVTLSFLTCNSCKEPERDTIIVTKGEWMTTRIDGGFTTVPYLIEAWGGDVYYGMDFTKAELDTLAYNLEHLPAKNYRYLISKNGDNQYHFVYLAFAPRMGLIPFSDNNRVKLIEYIKSIKSLNDMQFNSKVMVDTSQNFIEIKYDTNIEIKKQKQ